MSGRFIWYIWQRPNGIPMEQPTKSYVGGGGGAARSSGGRKGTALRPPTAVIPHSINYNTYKNACGERTFGEKLSVNYKYKQAVNGVFPKWREKQRAGFGRAGGRGRRLEIVQKRRESRRERERAAACSFFYSFQSNFTAEASLYLHLPLRPSVSAAQQPDDDDDTTPF